MDHELDSLPLPHGRPDRPQLSCPVVMGNA